MSPLNRQVSQALAEASGAVTEQLVAAQFSRQPQLALRYGPQGRAKCLQDAQYHLSYLNQAIAMDAPELFSEYVRWSRSMLDSRGIAADDLADHLRTMGDILRRNLAPEFQALAGRYLDGGLDALLHDSGQTDSFIDDGAPLAELARDYLARLLHGDRHGASRRVLDAVAGGSAVRDIYLHVFQPVQREVGRLWQTNRISVAEEHYCSAATQLVMSQLYPDIFAATAAKDAGSLVAVSVAGELHEIGVRMVADLFEMDGWSTYYLGANTPDAGVVQTLIDRRARLLCISATMTFNIPAVASLIAAVRNSPRCGDVKILVGGYPFNLSPELWRKLGADGHAGDASAAIAVARLLIALPAEAAVTSQCAEGLVLHCDTRGCIVGVVRDDLGISRNIDVGMSFVDIFDLASIDKAAAFIHQIQTREAAFDWEINTPFQGGLAPLHFAGSLVQDRLLIVASRSLSCLVHVYEQHRAGHQSRHDKGAVASMPAVDVAARLQAERSSGHFDELSRMNNELTNLQRELARSNAELESRVRARTAELETARDAAESASQAKSRFLDRVSHELRTPLNAILGYAQIMERAAEHREEVAAIGESGRQLLDLINDVLDAAHGQAAASSPADPGRAAHHRAGARRPRVIGLAPDQPECRVLVVEDEALNRAVLGRLMRDTGFSVREAEHGGEGVALFESWRPHFVWMDMRMPVMDGLAATRAIRALPGGAAVKIVAFTAHVSSDNHAEMRDAGCDDVLAKPMRDCELFEAMQRLLGLRFRYAEGAAIAAPNTRQVV